MSAMIAKGDLATWQEAFTSIAPRLYDWYRARFARRRDPEEDAQMAVIHAMERFRREWAPGKATIVWLKDALRRALDGRRWKALEEDGPRPMRYDPRIAREVYESDRVAPVRITDYTGRDLEMDAAGVGRRAAAAARMVCRGERIKPIAKALHTDQESIRMDLMAVALLVRAL